MALSKYIKPGWLWKVTIWLWRDFCSGYHNDHCPYSPSCFDSNAVASFSNKCQKCLPQWVDLGGNFYEASSHFTSSIWICLSSLSSHLWLKTVPPRLGSPDLMMLSTALSISKMLLILPLFTVLPLLDVFFCSYMLTMWSLLAMIKLAFRGQRNFIIPSLRWRIWAFSTIS